MIRSNPSPALAQAARKALAEVGVNARVRRFPLNLRVCINGEPSEADRLLAAHALARINLVGPCGGPIHWNQPHEAFAYHVH